MDSKVHYAPGQTFTRAKANETTTKEYDVVILGCGEGGKYLAWTLAREGNRVAVIERKYIGDSCPNIACMPGKNIIHSARVAAYVRRSEEFGIAKDSVRIDMTALRERKRKMVDGMTDSESIGRLLLRIHDRVSFLLAHSLSGGKLMKILAMSWKTEEDNCRGLWRAKRLTLQAALPSRAEDRERRLKHKSILLASQLATLAYSS